MDMDLPRRSDLAKYWQLDKNTVFLNHGSFGATPIEILNKQDIYRQKMEKDPVKFFERDYFDYWKKSIISLSEFINANPDGLVFIPNATSGVNTVLKNLDLKPGDQIIVTDHTYQACRNIVDFVTKKMDAETVVVEIPFNVRNEQEVVDLVLNSVCDRTVLALIDTVTSPTGMKMPFEKIIKKLDEENVDVLLDAAHGAGIINLDINKINAAYVTGNCHKWLCTPKGSAFLHIREDKKNNFRPLNISHGASFKGSAQEKFEFEFSWSGTYDPTPWMCIPDSIRHMRSMVDGGWDEIMKRNTELAVKGRNILCQELDIKAPFPDNMVSAIASIELPDKEIPPFSIQGDPLHNKLLDEYSIQVPIFPWELHDTRYIRISSQLYNHEDEYVYLAKALNECV